MQNLTRLVLRIHMKRRFSLILGVWICQKRREKKNQEFWYKLQFSCLQLVLFHTILGYLSIHKFNRFQGRRFPFMHPSAKASYSSPLHLVRGEWMNKKSGSALVWCYIASSHTMAKSGMRLVLPWSYWRLLGTTKADTFTPIISAWVGRLGPLIQSLQRAKESLTQICLFLLSFL